MAEDASLLAIVLDASALLHSDLAGLEPQSYLEQLLVFVNAYLLLNEANQLVVFAAGTSSSHLVFQSTSCGTVQHADGRPQHASSPAHAILAQLQHSLQLDASLAGAGSELGSEVALSATLSRALCFVNRLQRSNASGDASHSMLLEGLVPPALSGSRGGAGRGPSAHPRVLCLLSSPDAALQHIALMNAIFAAQRSGVAIDGCKLGRGHSAFLQQAAYLTGGIYLRPSKPQALVQYLLSVFAADPFSRQHLRMPKPTSVDLRAACFCHKRPIDQGYVCSVCLSIFCEVLPGCPTCGSECQPTPARGAAQPVR